MSERDIEFTTLLLDMKQEKKTSGEMRCAFSDAYGYEEGGLKELILYGYTVLPLAPDGILVLDFPGEQMKGGESHVSF